MNPLELPNNTFKDEWLNIEGEELTELFAVNYKNIESAIKKLKELFGMSVCNNTD